MMKLKERLRHKKSLPLPMAPPGWYPNPQQPDQLRWFDGTGWTEHVTPVLLEEDKP